MPSSKWTNDVMPDFRVVSRRAQTAFDIECFHSRGQHLCKFVETKESVCMRKEFNSHGTGLGHQHGRRFIVLGHQYGHRDVMWKHSCLISNRVGWVLFNLLWNKQHEAQGTEIYRFLKFGLYRAKPILKNETKSGEVEGGGGGKANKAHYGRCASITSSTILIATKITPQYPAEIAW